MKKSLSILLALFLALSLAACAGEAAKPVAEEVTGVEIPAFEILVNDTPVTHASLAGYPVYRVQAKTVNNSGTESTATYIGYAVGDVLKAAGLTDSYATLEAAAGDGYSVTLTGGVISESTTLLAVTKDDKPFSESPWLAPCSDTVNANYLKGTVSIQVSR